jgi:putative ABC transport system substrate-binding protein
MGNSDNPFVPREIQEVQAAAGTLGLQTVTSDIRRPQDIAPAFDVLKHQVDAVYLASEGLVDASRFRINILALGARMPTTWPQQEPVEAGGLMSYGPNFQDQFRRAADFVDKILRGTKAADIPVEQPTKFDLVVNLIVAKALGLDIPPSVLARADVVIE